MITFNYYYFPKWLKNERINQDLSVKDLSKKSNVSVSLINKIESGNDTSFIATFKLANALGYNIHNTPNVIELDKFR